MKVCLSNQSKTKTCLVHRLMGITFLGNPEIKPEIDHINGRSTDNFIRNLRWATRVENSNNRIYSNAVTVTATELIYSKQETMPFSQAKDEFGRGRVYQLPHGKRKSSICQKDGKTLELSCKNGILPELTVTELVPGSTEILPLHKAISKFGARVKHLRRSDINKKRKSDIFENNGKYYHISFDKEEIQKIGQDIDKGKFEWKACRSFPGLSASKTGGFIQGTTGIVLTTQLQGGYPRVSVNLNGKTVNAFVHTLVWDAWGDLTEATEVTEIDHKDSVKTNNDFENLKKVTHLENMHNPVTLMKLKRFKKI